MFTRLLTELIPVWIKIFCSFFLYHHVLKATSIQRIILHYCITNEAILFLYFPMTLSVLPQCFVLVELLLVYWEARSSRNYIRAIEARNDIRFTLFMNKVNFMLSKSQTTIPNLTHTLVLGNSDAGITPT